MAALEKTGLDGLLEADLAEELVVEGGEWRGGHMEGELREERGDHGGVGSLEESLERLDEVTLLKAVLTRDAALLQNIFQLSH